MTPVIPPKLGRYELVDELGKGAMGVVYLARDPIIGRLVALKTFRTGFALDREEVEQFRQRFLREAQSAGILSHSNIVTIHDVVEESAEGVTFIAMEYVRGVDLKELLRRGEPFPLDRVAELVEGIAEALDYAHAQGVVHRDVKPANVMLTDDGRVKITDFGIARVDASNLTQEGQLLGTPNYMAPEQVLGRDVDHRVDVFSLGVVLYELLTRHKPFHGENLTVVSHRIAFDRFTPPRDLGVSLAPEIEAVLERALAKQPADRFQSAGELAGELRVAVALSRLDPGPRLVEAAPSRAESVPLPATSGIVAAATVPEPLAGSTPRAGAVAVLPPESEASARATPADDAAAPADEPSAMEDVIPGAAARGESATSRARSEPAGVLSADTPAMAPDGAAPAEPVGATAAPARPAGFAGLDVRRTVIAAVAGAAVLAGTAWVAWPAAPIDVPPPPEHDTRVQVWGHVRRADELLRSGNPLAAVTLLRAGERLLPGRPGLAARRADAERMAQERASSVEQELQVERAVARGREALAANRLDEAAAAAQQALALDPDAVAAHELAAAVATRRSRRARSEVAAAVPAATPPSTPEAPAPPTVPAAAPVLAIDFFTELPQGTLAVYVGAEQVLNERFRFVRKTGVFRSEPAAGRVEARRTLLAGDAKLRVYVTTPGAAARVATLDGNFPAGSVRTLRVRLSDDGALDARLE